MQLSEHFTLEELTTTDMHGVDNTPDGEIIAHLRVLAHALEDVRDLLGDRAMHINSGYRSPILNSLVHGSPTSDHPHGFAADFICPSFGSPLMICRALANSAIKFDQIIEEGTWVHFSIAPRMRREVLTKAPGGGYVHGLPA